MFTLRWHWGSRCSISNAHVDHERVSGLVFSFNLRSGARKTHISGGEASGLSKRSWLPADSDDGKMVGSAANHILDSGSTTGSPDGP